MKARVIIRTLCLSLCCAPAFGQHPLVPHGGTEPQPKPLPAEFFKPGPELLSSVLNLPVAAAGISHHSAAAGFRSAFTHENLVKMSRNFIPGQPLPDGPSYVPLSGQQKWQLFLQDSQSANQLAGVAFDSLVSQATGAFPSFGGGMKGYNRRFLVTLAGAESATFFGEFLMPALLHQDPRYFPSQSHQISNRLAYAASRVFITRSDDGRNVVNTSLLASGFVEAAVANAYVPFRHRSVEGTVENGLAGLEWAVECKILDEFGPDIKAFLRRHQPKPLRRVFRGSDSGPWN